MAGNRSLHAAKKEKFDEFYTRREDIEAELSHYKPFFENKVVYCNCDDPTWSEFWQFFVRVFRDWKIKKLLATHYEPDEKNYAYKLELSEDTNGDGKIDWNDEPVMTQLPCNGDFRSAACIELLKEADIVVTNPPFSLFREYVLQLMEYNKQFLIIGPQNAITYNEIFSLIKTDKLWIGYGFRGGNAYFRVPDGVDTSHFAKGVYDPETKLVHFRNCTWYTNLDIDKRHDLLDLRGNYYRKSDFYHYDNCEGAIEVSKVANIPCDFDGIMGVPITFISNYSPDQFQMLGLSRDMDIPGKTGMKAEFVKKYFEQGNTGQISEGHPDLCYYDDNGKTVVPYRRVMVRLKHPEERKYKDED